MNVHAKPVDGGIPVRICSQPSLVPRDNLTTRYHASKHTERMGAKSYHKKIIISRRQQTEREKKPKDEWTCDNVQFFSELKAALHSTY